MGSPQPCPAQQPPWFRRPAWVGLFLVAAVAAAYSGSLHGPFVFDDIESIPWNPTIRHLADWRSVLLPPRGGLTVEGRPILNLSLAADYALGGDSVVVYHATNLVIHLLATLALFGVVRRAALLTAGTSAAFALGLAASSALLWGLHPLQTEAVTYVIQRAESLMGLLFLATLYGFLRMTEAPKVGGGGRDRRPWGVFSVGCCLLGMGTKEVMVSAPLIVLLLDRTLVAGSFRAAWSRRPWYYAALAATWIPLALLVAGSLGRGGTAGAGSGVSPPDYWLTQGPALTRYLRLTVWPHPLALDYGFEREWIDHPLRALPHLAWVLAAGVATVAALRRRSPAGLLGCAAFCILAPTSLIPGNRQTVAEHRMYLVLAPVIAGSLAVAFAHLRSAGIRTALVLALAAGLGTTTLLRNRRYASELALMQDAHALNPDNPDTRFDYGYALMKAGAREEGYRMLRASLELKPDSVPALLTIGESLLHDGRPAEALPLLERSGVLAPDKIRVCADEAAVLVALGRPADALPWAEKAVRLDPGSATYVGGLGSTLTALGRIPEAMERFSEAVRLDPAFESGHFNLGRLLLARGELPAALDELGVAVREAPSDYQARLALGTALAQAGALRASANEFRDALDLRPQSASARSDLDQIQAGLDQLPSAIARLEQAEALTPDSAAVHASLAGAYWAAGRLPDAVREYRSALAIDPANRPVQDALGLVLREKNLK